MVLRAVRRSEAVVPSAEVAGTREPPLVLQTMRGLLRDIFSGVYGPGDRIREIEVAERLGISRAPVREALRILEQDGLIEHLPWQGARVIDPTPEEMADLFDLLGVIQGAVARLVVRHASATDLRAYASEVRAIERAVAAGQPLETVIDLAYRAGGLLGRCCGSASASAMFRRVGRPAYWLHRFLAPVPRHWMRQSVDRQQRLLEALNARSARSSERAGRRLIQHTRTLVLRRATEAKSARVVRRIPVGVSA